MTAKSIINELNKVGITCFNNGGGMYSMYDAQSFCIGRVYNYPTDRYCHFILTDFFVVEPVCFTIKEVRSYAARLACIAPYYKYILKTA